MLSLLAQYKAYVTGIPIIVALLTVFICTGKAQIPIEGVMQNLLVRNPNGIDSYCNDGGFNSLFEKKRKLNFGDPCTIHSSGILTWIAMVGDSVLVKIDDDRHFGWSESWSGDASCDCPTGTLFFVKKSWWDERIDAGLEKIRQAKLQSYRDSIKAIERERSERSLKNKINSILGKSK